MPGDTKLYKPYNGTKSKLAIKKVELPKMSDGMKIVAQFKSPSTGEVTGPPLNLPAETTPEQLQLLLNKLLGNEEDPLPYTFFVNDTEISHSVYDDAIASNAETSTESLFTILYHPQAIFRVRAVTRCSSSLEGHTEAVLTVVFSPNGRQLASGDTTVRIWDLNTETPQFTLDGHKNWVQVVAFSQNCKILASGSMDSTIRLWSTVDGKPMGDALRSHSQVITSIAWEPKFDSNLFISGSKDGTAKIWDAIHRRCILTLGSHTGPVMCVKWGAEGLVYTGSRDKTIKVWEASSGKLVRTLEGHAHWVNHLALSTDFLTRTGPFDHTLPEFANAEEAQQAANKRYKESRTTATHPERLVSASDDFTLYLWSPTESKQPIARLTGHQQPVTHVSFSPDGRYISSSSFDKSIKLWDGLNGKFLRNLRGHVGNVYFACWSPDSRSLVSGSKDTTLKVWDVRDGKIKVDLPGHADEVFAVDWSPDGRYVASGGRDRVLKM
ncbi:hypothetical protein SmJEL517_g06047 [Synchytrium microbalum]|uniref:NLE domain-containing protein n=1 Tax=Synchytrium microbalum TaxID=1806994 RepID=A0A507BSP6_9FUNG|nr:uncharacterized protein SmJEL517_g06047 [Synchytrium microbalum]TPX30361.1 hypothetical protein SmJEL517_g06047 [Synchytrium microbalum]